VFGVKAFQSYGKYYDMLYQDKDYERECDFLEEVFKKYSERIPREILDAGCGTGGHALILAKRGYEVTGIDQSKEMIDIAKKKATQAGIHAYFRMMNMTDFKLGQRFDACISMFAAVDYVTTNEGLQRCFYSIRKHLEPGSLFIFDYWNGPAVLSARPSVRVKMVELEGKRLIRIATPQLEVERHLCRVSYNFMVIKDRELVEEFEEEHVLRFLFPEEVRHYLEENSFNVLGIFPFLRLDGKADETAWNVVVIARARDEDRDR